MVSKNAPQRTSSVYAIFWGVNIGHRFNLMPNVLKIAEKTHQSAQKNSTISVYLKDVILLKWLRGLVFFLRLR